MKYFLKTNGIGVTFLLVGCLLLSSVLIPSRVSAASCNFDEQFYAGNDILFSNPCAEECTPSTTTQPITVSNDHTESLLKFLTGKGLSLAAASGVAGNIMKESGFNPSALNSIGAYGIAQWLGGRKTALQAFASSQDKDAGDFTLQEDFLWHELNTGYTDVLNNLNGNKSDPAAAASYFNDHYEVSGDHSGDREKYAVAYYEQYKGSITDGSGVSEATPTADTPAATSSSTACGDSTGSADLGITGEGNFTDSGEVEGYATVLANAKITDQTFGTKLVGKNLCLTIVSDVWNGKTTGGYPNPEEMWADRGGSIGHADMSPKKGAILLFHSGAPEGHVVIYLGDNVVLQDGHMESYNDSLKAWGVKYIGWIDPNDLGWKPNAITSNNIQTALQRLYNR